jgi:hypothetical protein
VAGPATAADFVFLEAEDAFANVTVGGRTWNFFEPWQDSSGSGYVLTSDSNISRTAAQAPTQSPRLAFRVNLAAATPYFVWVRMMGSGDNSDAVWVGVNATQPGVANGTPVVIGPDLVWRWVPSVGIMSGAAGTYFVNVYMNEDGTVVDAIALARQGTTPPPFDERTWAYQTNVKVAQPQVCSSSRTSASAAAAISGR